MTTNLGNQLNPTDPYMGGLGYLIYLYTPLGIATLFTILNIMRLSKGKSANIVTLSISSFIFICNILYFNGRAIIKADNLSIKAGGGFSIIGILIGSIIGILLNNTGVGITSTLRKSTLPTLRKSVY